MREILFRAYSQVDKQMYYNVQNAYDYICNSYTKTAIPEDCFGDVLRNEDYIVEQYTGKDDKNGKKIFEGDIVAFRYGHNKDICEVVFENGAFGIANKKNFDYDEFELSIYNEDENYPSMVGNDNYMSLWEIAWNYEECGDRNLTHLEVIGNIHDNPELLKRK